MTKRYLKYTLSTLLALGLGSCESENFWDTFDRTVDGTIELSAGIASSAVEKTAITRGGESTTPELKAMQEGTLIHLKVEGYWKRINSSAAISKNTIYKAGTPTATANSLEFAGTTENSTMEPLYWDDFGVGDPANMDGETHNHNKEKGLTIYGVAVDGETDASKIAVDDQDKYWTSLSWPLATNGTDVLSKDILVSKNITGDNTYKFSERTTAKQMSFIHPLSMITFNINAGDGFAGGFKEIPTLTLTKATSLDAIDTEANHYALTSGNINIITGEAKATENAKPTKLIAGTISDISQKVNVVKKALVYPDTQLGAGDDDVIAVLEADGNVYYIKAKEIHAAMTGHTDYKTKAGHNYEITIKVNKQSVSVTASIVDWTTVSATSNAKVQFTADVTGAGTTTGLNNGDSFSLWMTKDNPAEEKTTTVTYNDSKLTCSPVLYWSNGSDAFKFRALAKQGISNLEAVTATAVSQGTDLLWGTTAEHKGNGSIDYAEGEAINPRTGDVPLEFKHAMSNVVVVLKSADETTDPKYVDLSKATFELTNLASTGTISLADGSITPGSTVASAITNGKSNTSMIMIPQEIGDAAILKISLNDNTSESEKSTTYSLLLKDCEDNGVKISKWDRGNKYTYTISILKEDVKFRVKVQDWTPTTGSGNATLDWD